MRLSVAKVSDLDLEHLFARIVTAGKRIGVRPLLVGGFVRDLIVERITKKDLKFPYEFVDLDLVDAIGGRSLELALAVAEELQAGEVEWLHSTGTARMVWKTDGASIELDFKGPLVDKLPENVLEDLGLPSSSYLLRDVAGRDLSINCLYMYLDTLEVLDPSSMGVSDIKEKLLRTPIPAALAIAYKPLISLRSVRLKLRYGFDYVPSLRNALPLAAEFLRKSVDTKRLKIELDKLNTYGSGKVRDELSEVGLASIYDQLK